MNGHVLLLRVGMGPGMAACSRCKRMLSIEEIVAEACTGPVTLDGMLDYLTANRIGESDVPPR
jgi:hypothetical protein